MKICKGFQREWKKSKTSVEWNTIGKHFSSLRCRPSSRMEVLQKNFQHVVDAEHTQPKKIPAEDKTEDHARRLKALYKRKKTLEAKQWIQSRT